MKTWIVTVTFTVQAPDDFDEDDVEDMLDADINRAYEVDDIAEKVS